MHVQCESFSVFLQVMLNMTRSDYFGLEITVPVNSLVSEPGVPSEPVILSYPTFSYASEENGAHVAGPACSQPLHGNGTLASLLSSYACMLMAAGISRLYGGVHYVK